MTHHYQNPVSVTSRMLAKQATQAPMLEKEHELNLARRWRDQGDERALEELTRSYLRLVMAIASRFKNYGLPRADLIQEGSVGLLLAASRFEPDREIRFSTYANWWIRATIQDYVLRNWSIVRTGTTAAHKALFFSLRRLRAKLDNAKDGPLSQNARRLIAAELGVKERDVLAMEGRMAGSDYSLNALMGQEEGQTEWQDHLADERHTPEESVTERRDSSVRSSLIKSAMTELSEREITIIRERRLSEDGMTLAALGDKLDVSKERVRQIEKQAMEKMRAAILNQLGGVDNVDISVLI